MRTATCGNRTAALRRGPRSSTPAPPSACTTRSLGTPAVSRAPERRPPASRARPWVLGGSGRRGAERQHPCLISAAGRGGAGREGGRRLHGPPHPGGRSPRGVQSLLGTGARWRKMVQGLGGMRRPLPLHRRTPPRFWPLNSCWEATPRPLPQTLVPTQWEEGRRCCRVLNESDGAPAPSHTPGSVPRTPETRSSCFPVPRGQGEVPNLKGADQRGPGFWKRR